jgi:hypothetical protein
MVGGTPWFYVGQTKDGRARIAGAHQKPSYQARSPSFLYFLWARAESVYFFLPDSDAQLSSGLIMNVLEQSVALVFLSLQPCELKSNLSLAALRSIPAIDMQHGVNVRELLGQNVSL